MKVKFSLLPYLGLLCCISEISCFVPTTGFSTIGVPSQLSSNKAYSSKHDIFLSRMVREATETVLEKEQITTEGNVIEDQNEVSTGFSYGNFAKQYPFANNIAIATAKTAAADLLAQTVIAQTPIMEIDIQRSFLFMVFGAVYLGGFQYLYQVQVFKRLFDIEKFTNLSIEEKLKDKEGLKNLALQTALDLTVLTFIYLPTFYIFKAGVFSGSADPGVWTSTGLENYVTNFAKDEADLLKVWFPADLVCFSVPLYLRLPVRHVVSFVWTAYLSFARGGH